MHPRTGRAAVEPVEEGPVKTLTDGELESLLDIFRSTPSAEQQNELALTLNAQVKDRVDELLERIEKGKDEKVLQAIELVGFARKAEVTPVLLKLAGSPDAEAARRAVDALGVNGDPKAVEPLLKMLSGGPTERAGRAAIALGRIGDVSAVPTMLERLEQSNDLVLRLSLIRGIGLLKDKSALPTLEKTLLESENPLEQTAVYEERSEEKSRYPYLEAKVNGLMPMSSFPMAAQPAQATDGFARFLDATGFEGELLSVELPEEIADAMSDKWPALTVPLDCNTRFSLKVWAERQYAWHVQDAILEHGREVSG